jgi:phosphoribosyl 1,2-cyclic phosphodiesterase
MKEASLILLGTNGASLSSHRAQTSLCLIKDQTTFVFDVGLNTPINLLKINALDNCETLIIHITHRHIDHIGGIFSLLQALTWSDEYLFLKIKNVTIYATTEVEEILLNSFKAMGEDQFNLAGYYPERKRSLELISYPDEENFSYQIEDIEINSVHLPLVFNHGIKFKLNEKIIALTGDATIIDENYINFCNGSDIVVFDLGHLIIKPSSTSESKFELFLDNVISMLSKVRTGRFIATHLTLRHLEHKNLSSDERESIYREILNEIYSKAKDKGFVGTLELGKDLNKIC